jgi:hypothetical protein
VPTLPIPIQHSLGTPSKAVRQEEEIKEIQIGKEEVKLFLFPDDMILYIKDPNNSTKKLLDTINTFSKVAEYKINYKNLLLISPPTGVGEDMGKKETSYTVGGNVN